MLRDFASESGSQDYSLVRRAMGMNCYAVGQYVDARQHLEESVAAYRSERDRGSAVRFGVDTAVAARCYLAITVWALGDIDAALGISEDAIALAQQQSHVPTLAFANSLIAAFNATRGDSSATLSCAEVAFGLAHEHGMRLYRALGWFFRSWALLRTGNREADVATMLEGASLVKEQGRGAWLIVPVAPRIAEAEAESGRLREALETIEGALAEMAETGCLASASMAHSVRGEILFKQNPANPRPAEDSFLTAIAIAQHQKTCSFELRAALSLAKLYRATGRDADAYSVLAPSLEGFAPTPKFPEIGEALALVANI
jgi:tetratricopeptide (TPR) repeat protein